MNGNHPFNISTYQTHAYANNQCFRPIYVIKPWNRVKIHSPSKKIDPDEVKSFFFQNNCNFTKTKKHFHIGYQRVKDIIEDKIKNPKPRKTTKEHDDFIIQTARQGRFTSYEIAKMLFDKYKIKVSHDTITRRLHEKGFSFVKPRKVQLLKPDQIVSRYDFALNMLNHYSNILEKIVFSDESKFSDCPDNCMLWREPDDYSERTTASYLKREVSTMAWGAIAIDYKSKLYFYKGSVNQESYQKCLDDTEILTQVKERGLIFQQDGASAHSTDGIINYITSKCRLLFGWPSNSPDLSPIEMIWAHMKSRLSHLPRAKTVAMLQKQLTEIWDAIPMETINKLVRSFKNRLLMCIQASGKTISHFISGGKTEVPMNLREDPPTILTKEQVKEIYILAKMYPRKWTFIAKKIESEQNINLTPSFIKFKALEMMRKVDDWIMHPDHYENLPGDVRALLGSEEEEHLEMESLGEIQINEERIDLEIGENLQIENQDSDWILSDNEDIVENL